MKSRPKKSPESEKSRISRSLKSKREDSELIKRAVRGDEAAFNLLLKRYKEPVKAFIYRMIGNREEAADLTQETFVKAFGAIASFNHRFAFSTWLYKIAQNTSIDYLRKQKIKAISIDQPVEGSDHRYELPDTTSDSDRDIITEERNKLLRGAIEELPRKYRSVIIKRHMEEKSYEEIADELKIPLGTVKAHIFRARELLNKTLRKKIDTD